MALFGLTLRVVAAFLVLCRAGPSTASAPSSASAAAAVLASAALAAAEPEAAEVEEVAGEATPARKLRTLVDFLNHHMFGEHSLEFDASAGAFRTTSPERKVLCQVGLGRHSAEFFEHLVRFLPQFQVVVFAAENGDSSYGLEYLQFLQESLDTEIYHSTLSGYGGVCDILVTSLDAPLFTFHSAEDVLRRVEYGVVLFERNGCLPGARMPKDRHACDFLDFNWRGTICGADPTPDNRGFQGCDGSLCMCFTFARSLMDPVYVPVNCSGFQNVPEESHHGTSQWHQDWFLYHNFLKHLPPRADGVYVDVGAYDPFLLSSTVALEQCLGWQGVCVEPNPRLVHGLYAYRSCTIFPMCVWSSRVGKDFRQTSAEHGEVVADSREAAPDEYFNPRDAVANTTGFSSTCVTLEDILVNAGLQGRRIDFLSVDVEHGEVEIFKHFPFRDWDIRMIVVETNRDTAFAVDVLLLPWGYSKVALLGKDAVYASHRLISEVTAARGEWTLEFPREMQRYEESYADFQRRFLTGDFRGEDAHF
eukprot:TRINITY_DN8081_c0_g2_i1.p1 TRINITY_DN8081_c0_g2~~TRINITY_DN8081_c0_g2_i1.p1  ORF type:complete len:533 (-),score=126.55 TRINITY_DN8081_c0_g2_i1:62-1660(-)